jgi:hypothetical protein
VNPAGVPEDVVAPKEPDPEGAAMSDPSVEEPEVIGIVRPGAS